MTISMPIIQKLHIKSILTISYSYGDSKAVYRAEGRETVLRCKNVKTWSIIWLSFEKHKHIVQFLKAWSY